MIIGLAGKKRCGKSSAAAAIHLGGGQPYRFSRIAFADPLKDMAESLLFYFGITDMYALDKEDLIHGVGVTLRQLYQSLGTEWGRKLINPELWVNAAARSVSQAHNPGANLHVVIEDVRFEDEADFIRGQGGLVVHIERPGLVSDDPHESENGIAFKPGDERLVNHNLDDFLYQFRCLVESKLEPWALASPPSGFSKSQGG